MLWNYQYVPIKYQCFVHLLKSAATELRNPVNNIPMLISKYGPLAVCLNSHKVSFSTAYGDITSNIIATILRQTRIL